MAHDPTVLVVDDEIQIQRLLKLGLGASKFKIVSAPTATDALAVFRTEEFDLVVLDLGLPDQGGLEVLKQIRKSSAVPVIVLSVRDSETEKVRAFELGADDYITKPFGMAELVARLRVALKHRFQTEGIQPVFHLGDLEIDMVNRHVRRSGQEIKLTKTEYEILCLLAQHPGKVLTHDFILRNIRGADNVGDPQYLRVYMRSLRDKLGDRDDARRVIRTEIGVGYRLAAPSAGNIGAPVS
jgi:two-component system KDP operon response regulator KdpE